MCISTYGTSSTINAHLENHSNWLDTVVCPVEPEDEPDPEIDARQQAQAVADGFDEHIVEQAVDAEWAAAMDVRFAAVFAAERLAGSRLGAVDCRSTLCRLEVSFDRQGDRDTLIEQASDLLEPDAQGFAHIEDGDDLEIQVYLSRQGTSLPTEG
jgi:hypothetical protein